MPAVRPSRQTFIVLVSLAVVVFVIGGFAHYNRSCRLGELHAEIREKEQKLNDSQEVAKRLADVEADHLRVQRELSVLEERVSTRAFVPSLLRQLEELGRSVNLKVVGVRPKPPTQQPAPATTEPNGAARKPEPYEKLDIDIEVNGKYADIQRFLNEITSFPKIVAVHEMQVGPCGQQQNETGSPMLSAKLNTTAFILKEEPVKGKGSTEAASTSGTGGS